MLWLLIQDVEVKRKQLNGIKDIVYKNVGHSQYAQIQVNGKVGNRIIPLSIITLR